jgi:hypothetical protein
MGKAGLEWQAVTPAIARAFMTLTASEILTALKTVDGSASGLDADLLDGFNSTAFENAGAAAAAQTAAVGLAVQRANHTGTQLAATISDLPGVVTGLLAAIAAQTYNIRTSPTFTVSVTELSYPWKSLVSETSSAVDFILPTEASSSIPVGHAVAIGQWGSGATRITSGQSGTVLLRYRGVVTPFAAVTLAGQWAKVTVEKIKTNEWWINGDIA